MVFDLSSPPRFHVYLLRCIEDRSQQEPPATSWRFSLEDPHNSQRQTFADLESLIAFLRTTFGSAAEPLDPNVKD